jgi:hypothetical protein
VIAHIIQDIIKEVSQRAWQKEGRGRRDAVVLGFLSEISEAIAAVEPSRSMDHELNGYVAS